MRKVHATPFSFMNQETWSLMFVDVPVVIMCANVYSNVWLPHGGKPHIASNNTSASSFEFVTVNI